MHPRLIPITIGLFTLLVACGPDDGPGLDTRPAAAELPDAEKSDGDGGLADIELCDAKDYRDLIGSSVTATTFPEGPRLRVFTLTDIVTQDYIPQRTNVVHDKGRISRVYCG